jgi:hypothetical protein
MPLSSVFSEFFDISFSSLLRLSILAGAQERTFTKSRGKSYHSTSFTLSTNVYFKLCLVVEKVGRHSELELELGSLFYNTPVFAIRGMPNDSTSSIVTYTNIFAFSF